MAETENWQQLYETALLELEHAKMAGRIGEARDAIIRRVAMLREIPGLHQLEREHIEDALSALRVLENEDRRYGEEERRIADIALAKLRLLAEKIKAS